jgi:transcriptional regulator with XRE-family HTH domain
MHLAAYMAQHGLSDDDLAAKIGRTRPTVSRIRRGVMRPDWITMGRILEATSGEVTPNDFVSMEAAE